jgi:hypothetical protein
MKTEKLIDWLVNVDISFYKVDYDPKCNSHFYLKGSGERFSSADIISIFENKATDKVNKNWQHAVAENIEYLKKTEHGKDIQKGW